MTLSETIKILELFKTIGVTSQTVRALLESGMLRDLLKAVRAHGSETITMHEYQRCIGIQPYVFTTRLGGCEDTDEIIRRVGIRIENSWINQVNFPLRPRNEDVADIELLDPGESFTRNEGTEHLRLAGLLPPHHEHAIRFAEQHGMHLEMQSKPFVLFLQPRESDEHVKRHLYLCRTPSRTALCMADLGPTFTSSYILAGVRPKPIS